MANGECKTDREGEFYEVITAGQGCIRGGMLREEFPQPEARC